MIINTWIESTLKYGNIRTKDEFHLFHLPTILTRSLTQKDQITRPARESNTHRAETIRNM